jgi:hypothetical protein
MSAKTGSKPTGLDSKPTGQPGKLVYIYPQCIMSVDPDGTMRCGRMDIYMQGPGGLSGLATTIVFPNATVGQACRAAQWVSWKRMAETKDRSVVRPGKVIGTVARVFDSTVVIALDEAFTSDPLFRCSGTWQELAIPKGGGRIQATTPGTDPSVAGSHSWIHRPGPAGLPFRAWAYGHAPVPVDVLARYPKADIEQVLALSRATEISKEEIPGYGDLVKQRVATRYQNPICQREGCKTPYVPEDTDFILCACCKLVFYCSASCQITDKTEHAGWACELPDSPAPRHNPHAPVMGKWMKPRGL